MTTLIAHEYFQSLASDWLSSLDDSHKECVSFYNKFYASIYFHISLQKVNYFILKKIFGSPGELLLNMEHIATFKTYVIVFGSLSGCVEHFCLACETTASCDISLKCDA